ncbi:hypothetical protein V6N11_031395 [Hibiscus sabdariffa]|uniref:MULE transposase domain-containing protein n=1 Tax=Hibiscus sabdariffa TaxID=183260 RepID=A0ABR2SXI6_9ROSI
MKFETLKQHCRKELGVYASFNKCQRARLNVLREKRGSYIEEYATLWGYASELLHSNPGSTISIQVHRDSDNKAIFHRMYICFDALKKGELLVAIGRDGNNQMFPVAWAVVEGEGKESWKWFLTKLMQDLNHPDGEGLTLMLDQQKRLVPIINQFFPALEHRMCARHIYSNWHKKWKGMNSKIQFWNCVRSTFVEDFDDQLKILEEMGAISNNDLLAVPPLHWSRAYLTGNSKCDVVDNNLAEASNGWIVDARCHPIISMLEEIRKMASQSDNNARTTRSMKKKFNETETIAIRPSVSNRKRQVGIGIYTDLRTGEQTLNTGLPSEQVVTRAAKRKIGASISQYNHASKGPGLKWRGKQAVTTRQLQQQQSDQHR